MRSNEDPKSVDRSTDSRLDQAFEKAADSSVIQKTIFLGLLLVACTCVVVLYYFGAVASLVFGVGAGGLLLALMHFAVRSYNGDERAELPASIAQLAILFWWIGLATSMWFFGDWPGRIISMTIGISWTFHIIFFSHNRSLKTMLTALSIPALSLLAFMVWSSWENYPIWLAIPSTIASLGTVGSIATSAMASYSVTNRMEAAVRRAESTQQRLEFAIEAAGDGYFELDLDTLAYRPNPKMLQNLGYKTATAHADGLRERIHPDDVTDAFANLGRVRNNELSGWNQDLRIRTATGDYLWMHLRARVLDTDKERTLLCTLVDLRERKALEEDLRSAKEAAERASSAKSEFLANMSHEIRTPLNGVLGMAQALEADGLSPSQAEKVSVIIDSGKSLTALLNDVLDFSKIEAGKLDIAATPGDFLHTMKRTRQLFQATAEEKGLSLSVRYDSDFPQRLVYDPVRVRQCVSNLLSNAIKFTAQGSVSVLVSARSIDESGACMVRVDVTDTGIGMNEEVQGRLFSAFTQADGATTRKFGGTGLGLAISRKLARIMGGDLIVTSEEGKGATFTLTFLAEKAQPQKQVVPTPAAAQDGAPAKPASLSLRGRRVLLTDDNAVNRQVIRLFLAPSGCEIVEATNGKEALDRLSEQEFDIVLLDVHMPVMDGKEAIQRIRAGKDEWAVLPVIALTADAMSGDREKYLALGMTDYVSKPVDQRELLAKMNQVLNPSTDAASNAKTGT